MPRIECGRLFHSNFYGFCDPHARSGRRWRSPVRNIHRSQFQTSRRIPVTTLIPIRYIACLIAVLPYATLEVKADPASWGTQIAMSSAMPPLPEKKPANAPSPKTASKTSRTPKVGYEPVRYNQLPGWQSDDHLAALKTFMRSCERVTFAVRVGAKSGKSSPPPGLLSACEDAAALMAGKATKKNAREFFETHFTPHRVTHSGPDGLLTGYYEPLVKGARKPSTSFTAPLLRRPRDLVNIVPESERGAKAHKLTHALQTDAGLKPYPTRQQIEQGALAGQKLELLYLKDELDVYFMQIQGSGRIALPDGSMVRVTYDGKNGYPYTSIGRYLIDKGLFPANRMSLQALKAWLRTNPERMRQVLWQNRSYVFFRELKGEQAQSAMGVLEIPLTPRRSLAVDTRYHAIGMPVYVDAPEITHITKDKRPFQRLMIAQDVGSAIRGPERGDIFCGSGDKAGRCAGITKHHGTFYVLVPRERMRGKSIKAHDKDQPKKFIQARQ